MKPYWITAGVGVLVAVVGGVVYFVSDERFGFIVILVGMVVGVLGLVMALIQWGTDKSK